MKTSKIDQIDREYLQMIVLNSNSFSAVLKYFEIKIGSSSIQKLKKRLSNLKIDHTALENSRKPGKKASKNEVLIDNSTFSRSTARRIILRENLIDYKCDICDIGPIWNNRELTLTLDHINGKNNDHRLENLRFVCPNCDSQSDTYAGKNIIHKKQEIRKCVYCDADIHSRSTKCRKCAQFQLRKCERPTPAELKDLVWKIPSTKIAELFGVTDKAVAKWCKKYDIQKPGPGFWTKKPNSELNRNLECQKLTS